MTQLYVILSCLLFVGGLYFSVKSDITFRNILYFCTMRHLLTVIAILLAFACCTTEADRSRMRAELDSINQRNRNDQPFTAADVQPYVNFFDDHGTANDRLLAHYLLGRAYHEHGEAPMALQCYQDALDCADTLSTDCDYRQLARVYGQMAQIFLEQGLYRQQLNYDNQSVNYAWKGKDTLLALRNKEQKFIAYNRLGIIDSAIMVIKDVAKKYDRYGRTVYSAISLGLAIKPLIIKGRLQEAKDFMNIYEFQSGRFDSLGNIEVGREIYYKTKGLYFLYTEKLDSAEYYFRKELRDGKDYNNQNAAAKGLVELYQKLHVNDSIAKYSLYAYAMSDSLYAKRTAKDVERIQAMYNYTRNQDIAHKESKRANSANRKLLISFIVLLAAFLISSWLYIARKELMESLKATSIELDKIRTENSSLKQNASVNKLQIVENEKRIALLEKKLGKYGKLIYFGIEKTENDLKKSSNYQQIKDMAYKGQQLSQVDWDNVCNLVSEYFPGFYDFAISNLQINSTEYKICLLLRLHFKAGEIANMLGVTPAYISKISTEILAGLYGKKGSSKELYKELCKLN